MMHKNIGANKILEQRRKMFKKIHKKYENKRNAKKGKGNIFMEYTEYMETLKEQIQK